MPDGPVDQAGEDDARIDEGGGVVRGDMAQSGGEGELGEKLRDGGEGDEAPDEEGRVLPRGEEEGGKEEREEEEVVEEDADEWFVGDLARGDEQERGGDAGEKGEEGSDMDGGEAGADDDEDAEESDEEADPEEIWDPGPVPEPDDERDEEGRRVVEENCFGDVGRFEGERDEHHGAKAEEGAERNESELVGFEGLLQREREQKQPASQAREKDDEGVGEIGAGGFEAGVGDGKEEHRDDDEKSS